MWIWQNREWPNFRFDLSAISEFETQFFHKSGYNFGVYKHISQEDQDQLRVFLISEEALKTSKIEGEFLDRDSIQASIGRQFGLLTDRRSIPPAEFGVASMLVDLYKNFHTELSHSSLFHWHNFLMNGRLDISAGNYRVHKEPMQVVSGSIDDPKVHFEAPPSDRVESEMSSFITWFNQTGSSHGPILQPLARAGMAHLYFVFIHPFEDGNGRIARAISEKALAQSLGQPTLIALADTIEAHRKDYYNALESANKNIDITHWLIYFSKMVLSAQDHTQKRMEFILEKKKFFSRHEHHLNNRQTKAIIRVFNQGVKGFVGGLSAENYISITRAPRTTATRDLNDLVSKGAFVKSGQLKYTRYFLNVPGQFPKEDSESL